MTPITVVIRVKDEAAAIGRLLELLGKQSVSAQVVVVDSGSTDGTVAVVRGHAVELVEIPAASFTFGGALNTGAERATAEVVVALSAHAFPKDEGWLARIANAMDDAGVACASGQDTGPDGAALSGNVVQDAALYERHPRWGYSSHAGAFRRSLWAQRPFRVDMPASEDKEWAWHWLQQGKRVVLGPDLMVEHSHSHDPLGAQFRRARIEWTGLAMYLPVDRQTPGMLAAQWWRETGSYESAWRARLSPRRAARLLGAYAGRRAASSRS